MKQQLAIFQDYARSLSTESKDSDGNGDEENAKDAASVFFELANAPLIGYRVADNTHASSSSLDKDDRMLIIKQHNDAKEHTGGIVWETSYLLAEFLSSKFGNKDGNRDYTLGNTLEIGSGCGLLGLFLATTKLASRVVLTEAAEVMDILIDNVEQNVIEAHDNDDKPSSNKKGIHGTPYLPVCPKECISVQRLRWDCLQEDVAAAAADSNSEAENHLRPHSFDTIVGTDVVFSPNLVCPLLETIQYMARMKNEQSASTRIYLCLQLRCADSHSLLFSEANKYGLEVIDVSEELALHCPWGVELECLLLQINIKDEMPKRVKKSSKEKKRKKRKKSLSKEKSKKDKKKKECSSKKRKRDEH